MQINIPFLDAIQQVPAYAKLATLSWPRAASFSWPYSLAPPRSLSLFFFFFGFSSSQSCEFVFVFIISVFMFVLGFVFVFVILGWKMINLRFVFVICVSNFRLGMMGQGPRGLDRAGLAFLLNRLGLGHGGEPASRVQA